MNAPNTDVPIQPVDKPILCNPYAEPADHWVYDRDTGEAKHGGTRRPAGYWYKTDKTGSAQARLFIEEQRDDLPLVNLLRDDVRRWRESDYRGAEQVTRELLRHWSSTNMRRRLFFCQREAVETIIYLAEIRIPGRTSRTGFQKFSLTDDDLQKLLTGKPPSFELQQQEVFPTLIDAGVDSSLLPLCRLGCKMATGSGKTVVMAMLIAWAFCNRGRNPRSREFPNAVLVCCPNLTVKERLQVLRPENPENYYEAFELVPAKYRPLLQSGKVLVTNWHGFAPESEHKEGDKTYAVVNKGPETTDVFAQRVLGELSSRTPIMVLNDEGHHCWRPRPSDEQPDRDVTRDLAEEIEEARVWLDGLDRINNSRSDDKPGIAFCVDLSATPFYLKGSGHPEGRPFPWLVSDFGLVDAIESGIVKIPRLPVLDTTGRPDPAYFRLWKTVTDNLQPAEKVPGRAGKPKADIVYRGAEGALQQIAAQWAERYGLIRDSEPGHEQVPPVLIIVCDNMEIAEVFYRKISGETEEEIVSQADVDEALSDDSDPEPASEPKKGKRSAKKKTRTVYGQGSVFPELLSNTPAEKRTLRIDSKTVEEDETLRRLVATVGKQGEPGEHLRCVVSVAMLTEGWDANNVTHILGVRAFGSQLLCEQVVGRGLRRMNYTPDPATGLLTEEYVDVYGIPFSVIPFKGRSSKQAAPEDKPKHEVRALPERAPFEIRFPVVEGFAFSLRKNLIRCDIDAMQPLVIEPQHEPTATFVRATVGYQEGSPSQSAPFPFVQQDRTTYYEQTHPQTIEFQIARLLVDQLVGAGNGNSDAKSKVFRLQSRHVLFPQILRFVQDYVARRVDFQGSHPCELGLETYVQRTVERLRDAIVPDDSEGEPPLLPILNQYKPIGTTADVNFPTVKPCRATQKSHINQVVVDTKTWEAGAAFRLEMSKAVECYARNDHLDFVIPYEYQGVNHSYVPDFLVRLTNGVTVVLEIKGFEDDQDRAKHTAAARWVNAVNTWNQLGRWTFHVCRNPQLVEKEMGRLVEEAIACANPTPATPSLR